MARTQPFVRSARRHRPARTGRATPVALAAALVLLPATAAQAQESIVVIGRSVGSSGVAGFGDVSLARSPLQVGVYGAALVADLGMAQLAGLPKVDASVGEAYNAEGYWSSLAVRGYALDNRYNLRRDGLPINGETAIALANKERFELIKGTSGIQAGTSSPAGLLNLVVKRPGGERSVVTVEAREAGSLALALDLGRRLGDAVAVRVNASHEELDAPVRNTRGRRSMLAVAADWRLTPDALLQAEIETSHQQQPSVAGYSLLGDRVPAPTEVDPKRNLNDQPWRQPVVFDGDTASLRWQQQLSPDWRLTLHGMRQRLVTDDRTAFPFGDYDPATFACTFCDRFAADGTFAYWEYISDNERRTTDAWQVLLAGRFDTGAVRHGVEAGVLGTHHTGRFQDQVFDIAGTGRIDGSLVTPPSAGFTDANTNRDERSTEWFVRDAMAFGETWQLWAGLRTTRLERSTVRTSPDGDGSLRPTAFERSETTPWLAVSARLTAKTLVYASAGRGLETDVAPNRARYLNAGESIALRSRQAELGVKHGTETVEASLTLFSIDRDQSADFGACDVPGSCTRALDGTARHRGAEASWLGQAGPWGWSLSAMWLDAERRGSAQAGIDGTRPVNVPRATLRAAGEWRAPFVEGLVLQARLSAESDRTTLPGNESLRIAGWSVLDLGARWRHEAFGSAWTWRLGVDNATDRRAWKESPYQFGHAYLYALAPRTWRLSLQVAS
ncbi:MAG: TonB-dependent receptor [Rubrivivax sp.]|nr:TonB-dependent receptor [Rubrivivax sp.]